MVWTFHCADGFTYTVRGGRLTVLNDANNINKVAKSWRYIIAYISCDGEVIIPTSC